MEDRSKLFRGIRSYHLFHDKQGFRLRGMYGVTWETSRLTATCGKSGLEGEDKCRNHLREKKCSCGIYALYDNMSNQFWGYRTSVFGDVVGWGAIIHAENGWRAEHVRIDRLWIDHRCNECQIVKYDNGMLAIPPSDWFIYPDEFICKEHLTNKIIQGVRKRKRPSGIRLEELVHELSERYTETEIVFGNPFRDS